MLISASGPAGAGTTPAPLDHFLCYHSTETGIKPAQNVLLQNFLQPSPFAPVLGAANLHCNPANKSVPVALFTAKNPLAHLLCFAARYTLPKKLVHLSNQFGTANMTTLGGPTELCLPSWKDVLAPPGSSLPKQPPGLDHFTCYPIGITTVAAYGFKFPSFVKVADEFSLGKYIAERPAIANLLCVPTTKIVAGVAYPPISANDLSLVCFLSVPTPVWPSVFDQNQFGLGRIVPTNTAERFCVPTTAIIG